MARLAAQRATYIPNTTAVKAYLLHGTTKENLAIEIYMG